MFLETLSQNPFVVDKTIVGVVIVVAVVTVVDF